MATARSETVSWDDVLTLAMYNYAAQYRDPGKIPDQIFDGFALWEKLNEMGHVNDLKGGAKVLCPIRHGRNPNIGSYYMYDELPAAPAKNYSNLEFNWKQYAGLFPIAGLEEAMAGGPQEVADIFDARMVDLEDSMKEDLNELLYLDGSGNEYKDITGLNAIIPEDPTTGTYAGWDRSSYSWHRTQLQSSFGSFATNGADKWSTFHRTCSRGRADGDTSFILVTSNLYGYYEDLAVGVERIMKSAGATAGDVGFGKLTYKGIPVIWDSYMPQDSSSKEQAYWINCKYLKLYIHKNVKFRPIPPSRNARQDARVTGLKTYFEMVCTNSRFQGRQIGIEA